jgi:hypothetical protein
MNCYFMIHVGLNIIFIYMLVDIVLSHNVLKQMQIETN